MYLLEFILYLNAIVVVVAVPTGNDAERSPLTGLEVSYPALNSRQEDFIIEVCAQCCAGICPCKCATLSYCDVSGLIIFPHLECAWCHLAVKLLLASTGG